MSARKSKDESERLAGEGPKRLGDLEAAIMRAVWACGEATVRDVRRRLGPDSKPAYTTVMTVMSRLAEKGLLRRHKEGRSYVYRAAHEQGEVAGSMLSALVDRLYDGSASRAIAHLLAADEAVDEAELARLERMIRERRERGRS